MPRFRILGLGCLLAAVLLVSSSPYGAQRSTSAPPLPRPAQPVNPDAAAVAEFMERVKAYVELHQKLEGALPKLPKEATPEQIDAAQRALAAGIQQARAGAKRGDLFTPSMTVVVRRVLNTVFAGPEGKQLRASIMDENITPIPLKVNQRYPDAVPLTTMPPEVLKALPQMPGELEFRFISEQLIILDPHAHIIVDFIVNALPGK